MNYYEEVIKLMREVTDKTRALTTLLKEKCDQDITQEQMKELGRALAEFTATMKGFGK